MKLEWARLGRSSRVPEPDNEILLDGPAACRVLLLHGLTGTPTEFAFVARFMRHRGGLSVECRRLVNHGQPMAILAETRWEQLLESAQTHLRTARARADRDGVPLVVGGLSLGAILALILAAEQPQAVDGVVALSPTLFYDGWNVPWTQRLIPLAAYLPVRQFAYLREQPPYGIKDEILRKKVAATYERAALGDDAHAAELGYSHFPLRLFCEMRHLIARCMRELPAVRAPLLVVQAVHDDATSPRNSEYILERVRSAQKALVLLENSYHVITADLDRAEVADRMTRFCLSLSGTSAITSGPQIAHG